MQQRNFILWAVASIFIMVGWIWLQDKLWPPPPKKKVDTPAAKKNLEKVRPALQTVNLIANRWFGGNGFVDWLRLALDVKEAEKTYETAKLLVKPKKLRWQDLSPDERKLVVLLPPPLPTTLAVLAQFIPRDLPKAVEPPAEEIVLGGEKSHLTVVTTTLGAGVQRVVLNRFKAANWLGRPAKKNPTGETPKLELVGDDPIVPSYLMGHYPAAKNFDTGDNPVLSLGQQIWTLEDKKSVDGEVREVRFGATVPEEAYKHLRIIKTYSLGPRDYHITLLLEIKDERDPQSQKDAEPFRYQLAGAHGLPIEGAWYATTYRNAVMGWLDARQNLVRTLVESRTVTIQQGAESDPPEGYKNEVSGTPGSGFLQYAGVATQFFASLIAVDDEQPKEEAGGVDKTKIVQFARPTNESNEIRGRIEDITAKHLILQELPKEVIKPYFLLPRARQHVEDAGIKKGDPVVVNFYDNPKGGRVATWVRPGQTPQPFFGDLTVRINSQKIALKPGEKKAHQFLLYHGPVKTKLLGQFSGKESVDGNLVDRYTTTLHLRTLTDYRSPGPFGAFSQTIRFTDLLIAVTSLMHWLLYVLHFLSFGSWGFSIILLTVVIRGLMFPISRKQAYFSVKMQEIAPELKKIKEKYGNDRKAQSEAMMELYRKHNVHPLGSCLPLLMQLPIFMGLYFALQESIHFRLAGFLWMPNLAAPDMLIWWTEKIPWISEPDNLGSILYLGPYLNLLPIVAVSLMVVQQKIMTPPPQDEQAEMQQKMMKYMMVFMGIMFYKVASGLCIYFIASSLWGLAERRFLPKKKIAAQPGAVLTPPAGKPGGPTKPGSPTPPKGKGKGPNKKEELGRLQKLKDWWAEVLKQAEKK